MLRNAYDIALEFVTEQSCGEWTNAEKTRIDASRLSDLICKDRDNVRKKCAEIADLWATPQQREHSNGGPAAEILRA